MYRACEVCEGQEFSVWDTKNDVEIVVCGTCGLGRAEMPEEAWEHVEEVYGGDYHDRRGWSARFERQVKRSERWVQYLTQMRRPGTFLDIGCSLGYCLVAAREMGWDAYGTDISERAVTAAEELGFKAFVATHPDEFPDWLPPLDAVVMSAVVEHFRDPFDYLRALRRRMAPGGVAYMYVPDFSAIRRRGPEVLYIGPPTHVWYFTRETAGLMLEKSGWRAVRPPLVRWRGIARRPHQCIPELLWHAPREILRPWLSDHGWLTNLHLFAQVK